MIITEHINGGSNTQYILLVENHNRDVHINASMPPGKVLRILQDATENIASEIAARHR